MNITNQSYINEFSFLDDALGALYEFEKETALAFHDYRAKARAYGMKAFFEGAEDTDFYMEKEKESLLGKIGAMVESLIKSISDFLKSIVEKFTGVQDEGEKDIKAVNKIIKEHPELKDQIIKGINEEWFTYKDLSAFENDVVKLTTMLEKSAIDHRTFLQKMEASIKKFNESKITPILTAASIGATALNGAYRFGQATSHGKEFLGKLSGFLKKFKSDFNENKMIKPGEGENEVTNFEALVNTVGQAVGLVEKECTTRATKEKKFAGFLRGVCNKFGMGDKFDAHMDKKNAKLAEKRGERTDKYMAQRERDEIQATRRKAEKAVYDKKMSKEDKAKVAGEHQIAMAKEKNKK